MKRILIAAIVASSLVACNRSDSTDTPPPTGENTISLNIMQSALSKGVSDQMGDAQYSVIGSGRIFFINASDVSIYQRELTAAEITALANTTTTAGDNTIVITGVPNTAVKLYFLANIKTTDGASFPMIEGTTSADARLRIDKLQANLTNVPMSGLSANFVQGNGSNFTASVTLTPIVARIELGQITVQNTAGAGQAATPPDITSYKLAGVFVNNTRQDVLLNGTPYLVGAPIDIRSQAGWSVSWATYFTTVNTNFPYHPGGSPSGPADWVANALVTHCMPTSNGTSFYPDQTNGATSIDPGVTPKKAWGYQVCPSTTAVAGAPADVPHLILKLTEVQYNDSPMGLPTQYVTVTKYKDDGGVPVTEFQRGNVYRIKNLIFTYNEATGQPYERNITVTATVSVAPWVVNNVNPDWD